MNLIDPHLLDLHNKILNAIGLKPESSAAFRAYLTAPAEDDSLLQEVTDRMDFRALHDNSRISAFACIIRVAEAGKMDQVARLLKGLWTIGGPSVCHIWGWIGYGRVDKLDTPQWRASVLGNARTAVMEAYSSSRSHGWDSTAYSWLSEVAHRDPKAIELALDLCGDLDAPVAALLSGLLVYRADGYDHHRDILITNLDQNLSRILFSMPNEEIRRIREYILAGDLRAPVPAPAMVNPPATDAATAQLARWGVKELMHPYAIGCFLASVSDDRARCALRVLLMLHTVMAYDVIVHYLPPALVSERMPQLLEDVPGGGVTMLLFYAAHPYNYEHCKAVIADHCAPSLTEAMLLADPDKFRQLQKLGGTLPKDQVREKLIRNLAWSAAQASREDAFAFLNGTGSLVDAPEILRKIKIGGSYHVRECMNLLADLIDADGWDDLACRCLTYSGLLFHRSWVENITYTNKGAKEPRLEHMTDQLLDRGLPIRNLLSIWANAHEECYYNDTLKRDIHKAALHAARPGMAAQIAAAAEGGSVFLRSIAVECLDRLGTEPGAKEGILAAMGDSSKQIKELVITILSRHSEWTEDIETRLHAKKAAERLIAAEVLGRLGRRDLLEAALPGEKNTKVADAMRSWLDAAPMAVGSANDLADVILRGNKLKKIQWLLDDKLPKLRKADGSDADERIRNAILVSYSELGRIGRSDTAAELASGLDAGDLTALASEVYERWYAAGAQTKHKWVLAFATVFGGAAMTPRLQKAINDWPNHQRGAIACEAVMALAMSSDPAALVIVDGMSRKFKFRQVKQAAALALESAAKELGITAEELADRIVPDLGFGKEGTRVFDYGKRSFTVRLMPTLELEIVNDAGKAVKNLPAPGKTDDDKATEAYEEFKLMKKQIKATVTAQRARLESALSVLRCWDTQRWVGLFVENPIMHQFAISLVWGVYADGKLTDTFRYMEDGTFNTADEEEYILPENAMIGLVHPVDLDEQTLEAWVQQLEDYEIKQSIEQLSRPVYRVDPDRAGEKSLVDFGGKMLSGLSLGGKLLGLGWLRGSIGDGGWYDRFYREDAAQGIGVELRFSGSTIGYDDGGNVTVYDAVFYRGTIKRGGYVDEQIPEESKIPLGQVSSRYYSEIVLHLTRATASSAQTDETWSAKI